MTILALNIDQLVVAINYSEDKHTQAHTAAKEKGGGHWAPADSSLFVEHRKTLQQTLVRLCLQLEAQQQQQQQTRSCVVLLVFH